MQDPILQWVAQRFFDRTLQPRELLTVRKGVYIGLILLLFTASFLWRRYSVEAQANALALREQSRGEVELSGSLIRLTLTGSRGLATCILWSSAIEKQKKNQWNELEFLVDSLTKLQPHFITPWLFQSWNLSYNVAVESDRVADKYFYVTRGVQLLARGERQNRFNPTMRWSIGFYMQHKICQSDETNVMRSLFQLSCMPPNERDPARFKRVREDGREEFNWDEFEKFCRDHPQLARRLREGFRRDTGRSERDYLREQRAQFTCETPDDMVAFLAANFRVPSLYDEPVVRPGARWDTNRQDRLRKDPTERFPVLPTAVTWQPAPGSEELVEGTPLGDGVDAYLVSRSWFSYAQESLPEPDDTFPATDKEITDRVRQRPPKMMSVLFRQYPALTQSLRCNRLQQEGWFDTTDWDVPDWFEARGNKFRGGERAALHVAPNQTAQAAWDDCYRMWVRHGERNLLLFPSAEAEANVRDLAAAYFRDHPRAGKVGDHPTPVRDPEALPEPERSHWKAANYLSAYLAARAVSNFEHHYVRARVERTAEATTARRLFYHGETLRLRGASDRALKEYLGDPKKEKEKERPGGVRLWLDLMLGNREFRDDRFIQEQTFEVELNILPLLNQQQQAIEGRRDIVLWFACLPAGVGRPGAGVAPLLEALAPTLLAQQYAAKDADPYPKWRVLSGPFDISLLDDDGGPAAVAGVLGGFKASGWDGLVGVGVLGKTRLKPLIAPDVARQVLETKGLLPKTQPPEGTPQPGAPPGPGAPEPRRGAAGGS